MLLTEVANFANMAKIGGNGPNGTSLSVGPSWDGNVNGGGSMGLQRNIPLWEPRPHNIPAPVISAERPTGRCSAASLLCDGSPVYLDDSTDCVMVVCSNPNCSISRWMHVPCFVDWEKLILSRANEAFLKVGGGGNGIQRGDESWWRAVLWTDVKYARIRDLVCACPCGFGYRQRASPPPDVSVPFHDRVMQLRLMRRSEPLTPACQPLPPPSSLPVWNPLMPPAPHRNGINQLTSMPVNGSALPVLNRPQYAWEPDHVSVPPHQTNGDTLSSFQWSTDGGHQDDFWPPVSRYRLFSHSGPLETSGAVMHSTAANSFTCKSGSPLTTIPWTREGNSNDVRCAVSRGEIFPSAYSGLPDMWINHSNGMPDRGNGTTVGAASRPNEPKPGDGGDVFNLAPALRQRAASIGVVAGQSSAYRSENLSRNGTSNGKLQEAEGSGLSDRVATTRSSSGSPTQPGNRRQRQASNQSTGSSQRSSSSSSGSSQVADVAIQQRVVRGNIFRQRTHADTEVFRSRVRHWNGYEVQLADDAQYGKDRLRTHVLVALSSAKKTKMACVACSAELDVFQDFPLIDGLFFESPTFYNCSIKVEPLSVGGLHRPPITDASRFYLNAVCLDCLVAKSHKLVCKSCRVSWDGSAFILGHVYLYDIFAAMPCCDARLTCKHCHKTAYGNDVRPPNFSQYSELVCCRHCGVEDHHYVKQLFNMFDRVAVAKK